MNKKVSIILPTLNGARYLRQSIDSCLAQTWNNIEIIVVDGGSTDGTLDILASYIQRSDHPRLSLVHQPANSGRLPGALNLGFARATGDYLTWMQDDNVYLPDAIEILARYLDEHPDVGFVYSFHPWIDENGNPTRTPPLDVPEKLRVRNCVGQFFLYRRCVYDTVGDYDTAFVMAEDYDYWVRVSLQYKMAYINDPQQSDRYLYRIHSGSLTGKSYGPYLSARVAAKIRRKWYKTGWPEYWRDLSQAWIEEAFSSLEKKDIPHLRPSLLRGLLYNPTWITNPGVASMFVRFILRFTLRYPLQALSKREK